MQTTIRLINGNDEQIKVTRGPIKMDLQEMVFATSPVKIWLLHSGTSTGEIDGETVYTVQGVRVLNESANSYHVQIRSGAQVVYEDQFLGNRDTVIEFGALQYFASYPAGYAISTIGV